MLNEILNKPFTGFPPGSVVFLKSLSNPKNNNRQWFEKHRDEYEEYLKIPMRDLIDELAIQINKIDPEIVVNYKSIFRINRDIRFSKDKTPYKTHYAAAFAFGKVKSAEVPQFYFHFSADEFLFAAGQYSMENAYLKKIRIKIAENFFEYENIIRNKYFIKEFKKIEGTRLTKIPAGFDNYLFAGDKKMLPEYLKMNQFYVFKSYKPAVILNEKLKELIISNIKLTYEFTKFLHSAIK